VSVRCTQAVVLSLFVVGTACADDLSAARDHYAKGTSAFDLGLYEEAISEYMAAYKAKNDPALLYNIAQSYRLAGHAPDALRSYKMYLQKNSDATNREEVATKIAELQKLIDQQTKAKSGPPPDSPKQVEPPTSPHPADSTMEAKPQPPAVAIAAPTAAPSAKKPAWKRAWVWGIVGGLVAAGVALGVGLGVGLAAHLPTASDGTVRF
jgi:tetratricopeptide (TPR) repeat protein